MRKQYNAALCYGGDASRPAWLYASRMPDNRTREQRIALMRKVRQKDTEPEIRLRSALHGLGYRFRKHLKDLPGKPDVVFTRQRIAVFVDGDFWHGRYFEGWREKLQPYWQVKIAGNIERDVRNRADLEALGWQVLRVWEKDLKRDPESVIQRVVQAVEVARRTKASGGGALLEGVQQIEDQ